MYLTAKVASSNVTRYKYFSWLTNCEYETKQREEKYINKKKLIMKTSNYELKTNGDTEMIGLGLNTQHEHEHLTIYNVNGKRQHNENSTMPKKKSQIKTIANRLNTSYHTFLNATR